MAEFQALIAPEGRCHLARSLDPTNVLLSTAKLARLVSGVHVVEMGTSRDGL